MSNASKDQNDLILTPLGTATLPATSHFEVPMAYDQEYFWESSGCSMSEGHPFTKAPVSSSYLPTTLYSTMTLPSISFDIISQSIITPFLVSKPCSIHEPCSREPLQENINYPGDSAS